MSRSPQSAAYGQGNASGRASASTGMKGGAVPDCGPVVACMEGWWVEEGRCLRQRALARVRHGLCVDNRQLKLGGHQAAHDIP